MSNYFSRRQLFNVISHLVLLIGITVATTVVSYGVGYYTSRDDSDREASDRESVLLHRYQNDHYKLVQDLSKYSQDLNKCENNFNSMKVAYTTCHTYYKLLADKVINCTYICPSMK